MDYKSAIGQKVFRSSDKAEGVLEKVDNTGTIYIKYKDGRLSGGYLFDPFISEHLVFADPARQQEIDREIDRIDNEQKALIDRAKALRKDEETYYVTLKNEDGADETVLSLHCSEEEAFQAFAYVVKEQQREFRRAHDRFKWRQVKLFETETGKKLAQES